MTTRSKGLRVILAWIWRLFRETSVTSQSARKMVNKISRSEKSRGLVAEARKNGIE